MLLELLDLCRFRFLLACQLTHERREPSLAPRVIDRLRGRRLMAPKRPEGRLEYDGLRIASPASTPKLPLVEAAGQLNGAPIDKH